MKTKVYFAVLFIFWSISHSQRHAAYHLVVGLEYLDWGAYRRNYGDSFYASATSGVPKDLARMKRIALRGGHIFETLSNEQATAENIKKKISEIGKKINPGDTFIFYYSGHGSERPDENGDEKSRYDQALAAYDDYLLDDEIYILLNRYFRKTDNIMIVDACHSATTYKFYYSFLDFKIRRNKMIKFLNETTAAKQDENFSMVTCGFDRREDVSEDFNLIYFGASKDTGEAHGDSNGGLMTVNLESIIINATAVGSWNTYTYPRLACELRRRAALVQIIQYHEIGTSVNKYADKTPFKTF